MKKLMFYINTINRGGAERVMTNVASQFADNDYDIVFVTSYKTCGEYPLCRKVKRRSLEEDEIKQSKVKRNVSRILKLRRLCKDEKPDVLIAFMGEPNFRAVVAAIGLPVKTVVSVRNDPDFEYNGKIMRFVGKHILQIADGCVFQTEDARRWFPVRMQRKSVIIFNAVKQEFYKVNRKPVKHLIIAIGRLNKQKNQRLLIDAVSELKGDYPELQLKIYGEGDLKTELNKFIMEKSASGFITLEGQTLDVPSKLSEADIFVLSSDYEGMPNTLMEAMAAGVPSIATDCPCGGPRMLIRDKENGILIPVGDKRSLVRAMKELLDNPVEKEVISTNTKRSAAAFSENIIYLQWKEYLEKVLSRG